MLQVRVIFFIEFSRLKMCRMNLTTPLECWGEVTRFKTAVADAETVRKLLNFSFQCMTSFAAIPRLIAMIHHKIKYSIPTSTTDHVVGNLDFAIPVK